MAKSFPRPETLRRRRKAMPPGYIDKYQAADILGMHPESFLRALRKGRLRLTVYRKNDPALTRVYIFERGEVEALAAHRSQLQA